MFQSHVLVPQIHQQLKEEQRRKLQRQQVPNMTILPPKQIPVSSDEEKKAFLSVLHSMKQEISHPLKMTPGSSAPGDKKTTRVFFFFWPLQPLSLLVLPKNIHQGF